MHAQIGFEIMLKYGKKFGTECEPKIYCIFATGSPKMYRTMATTYTILMVQIIAILIMEKVKKFTMNATKSQQTTIMLIQLLQLLEALKMSKII